MTRSSANNITHGGSFPISVCSTSMMSIKRSGLNADPWCNPTPTWKYSVSPALVDTRVSQSLYISCIIVIYPSGTPFFRRHHHINSRGTRSYAFSKSTKTMWSSLFISLYFSWSYYIRSYYLIGLFSSWKPYLWHNCSHTLTLHVILMDCRLRLFTRDSRYFRLRHWYASISERCSLRFVNYPAYLLFVKVMSMHMSITSLRATSRLRLIFILANA